MSDAARIRRPFRTALRKPGRMDLQRLVAAVHGPDVPRFMGSPYEGMLLDGTETALHELSHAVQIPVVNIVPGRVASTWHVIDGFLKALPPEESDEYEVGAISIELRVATSLELPLSKPVLAGSGSRNCRADHDAKRFERRVEQAWTTPRVLEGAQRILDLLDRQWLNEA